MHGERLLLLGCSILGREIRWLIEKNGWPMDVLFLDSALHIDLEKLFQNLTKALADNQGRNIIVFYGACHPLLEKILSEAKTFRTMGQNCVDMLLGNALFTEELSNGAFFLLEDWALRWNHIVSKTFGKNAEVIRAIFQLDRKYLLGVKTPCSGDFTREAEEAGQMAGLPPRWMDVSLDHLESVLQNAITLKIKET